MINKIKSQIFISLAVVIFNFSANYDIYILATQVPSQQYLLDRVKREFKRYRSPLLYLKTFSDKNRKLLLLEKQIVEQLRSRIINLVLDKGFEVRGASVSPASSSPQEDKYNDQEKAKYAYFSLKFNPNPANNQMINVFKLSFYPDELSDTAPHLLFQTIDKETIKITYPNVSAFKRPFFRRGAQQINKDLKIKNDTISLKENNLSQVIKLLELISNKQEKSKLRTLATNYMNRCTISYAGNWQGDFDRAVTSKPGEERHLYFFLTPPGVLGSHITIIIHPKTRSCDFLIYDINDDKESILIAIDVITNLSINWEEVEKIFEQL